MSLPSLWTFELKVCDKALSQNDLLRTNLQNIHKDFIVNILFFTFPGGGTAGSDGGTNPSGQRAGRVSAGGSTD